ncbi:MAG: restriction endonuclease subunit S [Alphaproteobacteria bacterium]|nr:restriction endonuclease subunit S [Alphaproteobacteria bacterium]MBR1600254.1 restriction endonuclease subunit S [Alphaproteobacteria bacterium]
MPIIDDICIAKTKGIAAKDVDETGKYPVFGATGLMGYLDTYESENEYIGIIKDGAGVGRTNIYPAKSSLLGTMQYIFPKENIDIKYLMYLLRSLNLGGAAAGAAIPHIYFKNYKKSVVPECNFEKQKLISKLLEKIENLIKLKQKQIFSLDELVKSRFICQEVAC